MEIKVVKESAKLVSETENLLSDVSKLPLPLQIVLRAIQHFTDKAFDSADIEMHYRETEAFFKISTRRSTLLFEKLPASQTSRYQLYFERARAGTLLIKKVVIECSDEVAAKFAGALKETFSVALYEGIVDIRRVLEFFQSS